MISIGDYNAYQFNDGYTDPIATIKGMPTPDDQIVVDESPDLVEPNFLNLTDTCRRRALQLHLRRNASSARPRPREHGGRTSCSATHRPLTPTSPKAAALFAAMHSARALSDHDMPVAYFRFPPPSPTSP